MEYQQLLDLAVELGYRLAICGAETFRVEESIQRVLATYGIASEVFAIPNSLTVSIETADGTPLTRMRRIGHHGNDLDGVERYSGLSRRICSEKPEPWIAQKWLTATDGCRLQYRMPAYLLGNFLGSMGFCIFYGGSLADGLCAGICGLLGGIMNHIMDSLSTNPFFRTIASAFFMAVPAYAMAHFGLAGNADAVIIGCLMLLVPGLVFTNAMRDIIFGDTNSGVMRIVQVFLVAVAIALGTATALNLTSLFWAAPAEAAALSHSIAVMVLSCAAGCVGFSILFNIHGPGMILCALGGILTWAVYALAMQLGTGETMACFWCCVFASAYAEIMARIRKYPAISYLVVAIFPMLPGAGIYYTMNYAVQSDMARFSSRGMHTVAIAGAMAVGILLVSTSVRLWSNFRSRRPGHFRRRDWHLPKKS